MRAQDETVSLASSLKHHKLEQPLRSKPFREPKWEKQHLFKDSELFPLIVPFFIGFCVGSLFFFLRKNHVDLTIVYLRCKYMPR